MEKYAVSLVVPFYNEEQNLPFLIKKIKETEKKFSFDFECIFVDDGSTDNSLQVIKDLQKDYKKFKIISLRKNTGKSAALSLGFQYCTRDHIATIDADMQDDPEEIPHLFKKLLEGHDMVVGWRKFRKDSKSKILQSKIFNSFIAAISSVRLHDMNCGLKVFTKNVASDLDIYGDLHRFIPLLAVNMGFKVTELPVEHHFRKFGASKFTSSRILHSFFDLASTLFLNSFKHRPMQIFGITGVGFFLTGLVILVYLSYLHFIGESIGRRPAFFLGILLISSGVQIYLTGLLAELITNLSSKRNNYPIKEIYV